MRSNHCTAAALLALVAGGAAHASFLGVAFRDPSFSGNTTLYDVDDATGMASNPRTTGATNLLGVSFGPSGSLFALTDDFGDVNGQDAGSSLLTIDPSDGATSVVGSLGREVFEGDLDFDPTSGALYGVSSQNNTSSLFTIDPSTGDANDIGATPAGDASAMAFDDDGGLWVLDTTFPPQSDAILYELDPATGDELDSVSLGMVLGTVAGMDFSPSGELFIADGDFNGTDNLWTADTTTGELSLVGSTGLEGDFGGLSGLEYVPSPGTGLITFFAAGGLARRRRR